MICATGESTDDISPPSPQDQRQPARPLVEEGKGIKMKCSVSWCSKAALAKGFCSTHYARNRRCGDPLAGETEETKNRRTKWTEEEKKAVLDFVKSRHGEPYSIDALAKSINRPRGTVATLVSKAGLGNYNRKESGRYRNKDGKAVKRPVFLGDIDALRKHQSEKAKKRIMEKGHPRGMLGKKHKEENKIKFAAGAISYKANATEEQKQQRIEKILKTKMNKYGTLAPAMQGEKMYSRAVGGKRLDLDNRYFRSKWEANYARFLNFLVAKKEIIKWEYEVDTFWFEKIKRGTRSYTPDFKIFENNGSTVYHEVKGWMDDKSKTKLQRMCKYFPEIKIIIIAEKEYRSISQYKSLIPGWE